MTAAQSDLKTYRKKVSALLKKNPIIGGYSEKTLRANIAELTDHGHSLMQAAAIAYKEARAAFKRKYPNKAYPYYLRPARTETNSIKPTHKKTKRSAKMPGRSNQFNLERTSLLYRVDKLTATSTWHQVAWFIDLDDAKYYARESEMKDGGMWRVVCND